MPTNRIPAISSEVPIGYRINGDEMLSFMPTTGEGLAHLVPKAGSALLMARGGAFPHVGRQSAGLLTNPGRPFETQHTRSDRPRERKRLAIHSTFVLSTAREANAVPGVGKFAF